MTTHGHSRRRLIVTDFDSTLIRQEVIDVLARHAGAEGEVSRITEAAMAGQIDFATSLSRRVALLEGLPVSVLDDVRAELELSPGAREFVADCHERGWFVGVISGGFAEIVEPFAKALGVDAVRANHLAVSSGYLTGETVGEVVDRRTKETTLRRWATAHHIALSDTIAIGDGANDLDMLAAAGIGIAYRAKPAVRDQAAYHVDGSLAEVLAFVYGLV